MKYPTRQDVQAAIARKNAELQNKANAKAKADGQTAFIQANWLACAACEAGLNATLSVVILAAMAGFPEDLPAIAAIASACGISEAVVNQIFANGVSGLETVISSLCSAMGAC
jgi:hypothetical protein